MTERTLVTKLIYSKTTGHIDLIGRGHQYKDFTLFDASDLQEVGIDINSLETGVEIPCRFWAIWEASDKRNKAGNPYKDIVALEPISKPATTTSTDTSSLLDELRGVNVQLEALIQLFTPLVSRLLATEPPAAPPAPAADPYPAGNPVADADAEPQVDRETGEIGNDLGMNTVARCSEGAHGCLQRSNPAVEATGVAGRQSVSMISGVRMRQSPSTQTIGQVAIAYPVVERIAS